MAPQTGIRSAATAGATGSGTARARWPYAGADQLPLLLASLAMMVGSFMPWVMVGGMAMAGVNGAGLWTLYGASLGLAGALVRQRRLAAVSAAAAGALAVGLGGWQVVHLVGKVGLDGWHPGIGLVAVLIGGIIALRSAWRLGVTPNDLRTAEATG
jgi:hypothetical protein